MYKRVSLYPLEAWPCISGNHCAYRVTITRYGRPCLEVLKSGKIFTGPTYKLHLSFTVISDVCKSFIPNKITFAKYCLAQWISKLPGSFEIHYLYKAVPGKFYEFGGHGERNCLRYRANFHSSRAWQIVLSFYHWPVSSAKNPWPKQYLNPLWPIANWTRQGQ